MKVILFNGSRRENGCTYTALSIVANQLKAAGIETKIVFVGGRVLKGEVNEVVHEAKELLETADGVVYGSPVYYASPSGEMLMFLEWYRRSKSVVQAGSKRGFRTPCRDDRNSRCAQ